MAKRKIKHSIKKVDDTSHWNFILFLTLAFILLVSLLGAINKESTKLRARAGLACPEVTLPRAEDCPGGWKYHRDVTNGCPTFVCEAK